VGHLPDVAVRVGERAGRATPFGDVGRAKDGAAGSERLVQHEAHLFGRPYVMGKLDPGRAVTAERGPEAQYHPTGLEEADLVVGLAGPAPPERFVEGARPRKICHAKGHKADSLFHRRSIAETETQSRAVRCSVLAMESGHAVTGEARLREIIGPPKDGARAKVSDRLNDLTRQFIERSPFVCVATGRPDGGLDISPRGDPPGFVRVLDERTLLVPERPGNRIADTLTNLLEDPRIALLFLIPGIGDTFRVNGRAMIVDDPELLRPTAVQGKVPRVGILIGIEEAYTQCAKALIRSELWNPERHIDRRELPSSGKILQSLTDPRFDADAYDRERAQRYARREGFY
jgi:PPOX class probable FMN-dependent enzyme